jgi:AAA+ ATPase superfamily predicted ATPase
MKNIKFFGREKEIEKIKEISKDNFFLVVKGRRRVGKTRLLKEALPDAVYIFIWPDKSIDWINGQICQENKIPPFKNFKDILEYFLENKKMLVIDEFQNLLNIDKSVYGEIQKLIDDRKSNGKFLKIAVAGSSYSLMNKVFNDSASPLYGRRTDEITLYGISAIDLFKNLGMSIEELIKVWSIFEGVPYYYELIDFKSLPEKNIKKLILSRDSQLQEEGKILLSVEFGKDSRTYNTVLTAISEGKTKLNEIASLFDNKKNEVVKYLDILRKDFRLVRKITPMTENPNKSKEGRYEIIDNFLSFWFYFIDKNRNYIEQDRFNEVEDFFDKNFNSFIGRKFEKFITYLINEKILLKNLDFSFAGSQWGKDKKSGDVYEIDIVSFNKNNKEILFGECKWKEKVNSEEIVKELVRKSAYVDWNNEDRKDIYAVFAKSFSKKIDKFDGKKVYCFDLNDLEKLMSN